MNVHLKVQSHHRERSAYLYIRQSSMRQVIDEVYDHSGNVTLEPDMQVRETIVHFFETFSRVGSASQTIKAFRQEGILFPSRLHDSQTVFRPLTPSTAMRVLHNPRYAGAYAYGRRRYRRTIDGKRIVREQDNDHWTACIPDAHPGYISWEQHQENLRILKSNICHKWNAAVASPPREGLALLQGRAVCGQCGRHFRMRYAARRGRQEAWYVCDRGELLCQAIAAPPVDEAIGILIAEQMTPAAIELAIEVRKEIEARHEEADRLRSKIISERNINNPRTGLKAFRYNPRLHIIGPSPVSTTRLDNFASPDKSLTIRPSQISSSCRKPSDRNLNVHKHVESMGCRRRIRNGCKDRSGSRSCGKRERRASTLSRGEFTPTATTSISTNYERA